MNGNEINTYEKESIALALRMDENAKASTASWEKTVRLIITLSSTYLILSFSFIEKLLPKVSNMEDISPFMIISWFFLAAAIALGLIHEIQLSIEYANFAKYNDQCLKDKKRQLLLDRLTEHNIILVDLPYRIGAACIFLFLMNMITIPTAILNQRKIITNCLGWWILVSSMLLLLVPTIYLQRKRYKK